MSDTSDALSRLSGLGFTLPPFEVPEDASAMPWFRDGRRLVIGGMAPFILEDMAIPRLGQDANVDPALVDINNLDESHPLRAALMGSRLVVLRVLSAAAAAAGDDLNNVEACVRASLTVRTGPNFERLGLLTMPISRIMGTVFERVPAISVAGVSALPAAVPMMLETEFLLKDG